MALSPSLAAIATGLGLKHAILSPSIPSNKQNNDDNPASLSLGGSLSFTDMSTDDLHRAEARILSIPSDPMMEVSPTVNSPSASILPSLTSMGSPPLSSISTSVSSPAISALTGGQSGQAGSQNKRHSMFAGMHQYQYLTPTLGPLSKSAQSQSGAPSTNEVNGGVGMHINTTGMLVSASSIVRNLNARTHTKTHTGAFAHNTASANRATSTAFSLMSGAGRTPHTRSESAIFSTMFNRP